MLFLRCPMFGGLIKVFIKALRRASVSGLESSIVIPPHLEKIFLTVNHPLPLNIVNLVDLP